MPERETESGTIAAFLVALFPFAKLTGLPKLIFKSDFLDAVEIELMGCSRTFAGFSESRKSNPIPAFDSAIGGALNLLQLFEKKFTIKFGERFLLSVDWKEQGTKKQGNTFHRRRRQFGSPQINTPPKFVQVIVSFCKSL
jgi:hypothetical protein